MSEAIHPQEEFSVAMQQLSAEAAKTLPMSPMIVGGPQAVDKSNLAERILAMEKSLLAQFERFAGEIGNDFSASALRCCIATVNSSSG